MASPIEEQLKKIRRDAEERQARRRAAESGLDYLDLTNKRPQAELLQLLTINEWIAAKALPLELKNQDLVMAVVDSKNAATEAVLTKLQQKGLNIYLYQATEGDLMGLLNQKIEINVPNDNQLKIEEVKSKEILKTKELNKTDDLESRLVNVQLVKTELDILTGRGGSVTEIMDVVVMGAIGNRASDIHLEPEEERVRVRYRIDGDLREVFSDFPKSYYRGLLSRIKLLAKLKIDVTGEAQDGRFTVKLSTKNVDFRVSIVPSEFGETVVIRVLDPIVININITELGLRADDLVIVEQEILKPNGMILNTGPTGSGKTTTLYSFLRRLNKPEVKIITIEDPIEYDLEGIEQTQVSQDVSYNFANGLKSLMRQDPDVILVGEIRDMETANAAIQAALTGHRVFSTVHANEAAGAMPRLLNLGIDPTSVGPALNLIMAQRLVRRLCDVCKREMELSEAMKNGLGQLLNKMPERVDKGKYQIRAYEAVGCDKCNEVGYKGRIGIFELLVVDREMERLIENRAGESEIYDFAVKQGMVTMKQDGVLRIFSGLTTIYEVEKAVGRIMVL